MKGKNLPIEQWQIWQCTWSQHFSQKHWNFSWNQPLLELLFWVQVECQCKNVAGEFGIALLQILQLQFWICELWKSCKQLTKRTKNWNQKWNSSHVNFQNFSLENAIELSQAQFWILWVLLGNSNTTFRVQLFEFKFTFLNNWSNAAFQNDHCSDGHTDRPKEWQLSGSWVAVVGIHLTQCCITWFVLVQLT